MDLEKKKIVPYLFDYITPPKKTYTAPNSYLVNEIAFTGASCKKSQFVYTMDNIKIGNLIIFTGVILIHN